MEIAKDVFNALPEDGDKLSEKELKALTGLNLGQIKEAKKFLKDNGLTKAYRGRGGYVSRIEGAKFPEEENTMSAGEKRAASRAESAAKQREIEQRNADCDRIRVHVASEVGEHDNIDVFWIQYDMFYAWVWNDGYAKGYKVFANEI
jgi:DNA-binding GntR family transcriptional regulator